MEDKSLIRKLNRRILGNLCSCHCGSYTKPGNKFIYGHHKPGYNVGENNSFYNKHHTEESRRKMTGPRGPMSESHRQNLCKPHKMTEEGLAKRKLAQNTPQAKENQSKAQKLAQNVYETKQKRSKSLKLTFNDPKIKEKLSIVQVKAQNIPETKEKRSRSMIAYFAIPGNKEKKKLIINSEEVKEKIRNSLNDPVKKAQRCKLIKIALNKPEVKENHSYKQKQNWQTESYVKKQMKTRHAKQNKMEKKLENTIDKVIPNEYKFVGHGEVVIAGKCPDFININGQKKIIELYGDYWHQGQDPQDRIDIFSKFGYDTLVIWGHELNDAEKLKIKLIKFHNRLNPYSVHGENNVIKNFKF